MLKHIGKLAMLSSPSKLPILPKAQNSSKTDHVATVPTIKAFKVISNQRALQTCCGARRRAARYDDEDDDESGEEEHGYNKEIAILELYSQSVRGEALLVHALVDEQEVEVLIFKGFSSCLSYGTSPDPSRSVIPARAVIKSVDRIKGPFDPSSIEYIEKGLEWESFKTRLAPT